MDREGLDEGCQVGVDGSGQSAAESPAQSVCSEEQSAGSGGIPGAEPGQGLQEGEGGVESEDEELTVEMLIAAGINPKDLPAFNRFDKPESNP
mgnify:CR=1 FL=1